MKRRSFKKKGTATGKSPYNKYKKRPYKYPFATGPAYRAEREANNLKAEM